MMELTKYLILTFRIRQDNETGSWSGVCHTPRLPNYKPRRSIGDTVEDLVWNVGRYIADKAEGPLEEQYSLWHELCRGRVMMFESPVEGLPVWYSGSVNGQEIVIAHACIRYVTPPMPVPDQFRRD